MTLMQLIKLVLDDAYACIDGKAEAKDKSIKKELKILSSEYANLTQKDLNQIDYSEPLKRFAYIYKYTVAHADYIMQLISAEKALRNVFKKDNIEVACMIGNRGQA